MRFSLDGHNYHYDYEWEKAPNFCAVHYLHSLEVSKRKGKQKKPDYWREEWDGPWHGDVEERPVKDFTEAAVNTVKECLMMDQGTKLMICDRAGGTMHESLIKPLAGVKEIEVPVSRAAGAGIAKRVYAVEIGQPYKNFNTGREVIECCIRRIK